MTGETTFLHQAFVTPVHLGALDLGAPFPWLVAAIVGAGVVYLAFWAGYARRHHEQINTVMPMATAPPLRTRHKRAVQRSQK